MGRRNVQRNLAEKIAELKGGERELSEERKKIQQKIHNTIYPFGEVVVSREDEDKIIDFLDGLLDKEEGGDKS